MSREAWRYVGATAHDDAALLVQTGEDALHEEGHVLFTESEEVVRFEEWSEGDTAQCIRI